MEPILEPSMRRCIMKIAVGKIKPHQGGQDQTHLQDDSVFS